MSEVPNLDKTPETSDQGETAHIATQKAIGEIAVTEAAAELAKGLKQPGMLGQVRGH